MATDSDLTFVVQDDDPIAYKAIALMLKHRFGMDTRVVWCESGQALRACNDVDGCTMVIMSDALPDLPFASVVRELSARYPAVPVLVLAAWDGAASRTAAVRAGAQGFASRADTLDAFEREVCSVLGWELSASDVFGAAQPAILLLKRYMLGGAPVWASLPAVVLAGKLRPGR